MSSNDAPCVDVRVLGTVQLLVDGAPVAAGGPKQRGVLAMLVLGEGHPVSLARLIDGIWGAEAPSGARGVIHSYVAELRRSLGPDWRAALRTVGDGYSLELPARTTDLERFQWLVDQARNAAHEGDLRAARGLLASAVAECRGDPLSDVADLAFAVSARVRLDELVMNAREEALEIDVILGAAGDASAELARLAAEHPYRERLWELLALARYRHGRQVEALDAVKQARRLLREEVGIDPNPRLAQIEVAILRQQPIDRFWTIGRPADPADLDSAHGDDPPVDPQPDGRPMPRRVHQPARRTRLIGGSVLVALALFAGLIGALSRADDDEAGPIATSGSIGVVDAHSGQLVASVAVGRSIAGITSGDDRVFATDPSGRVLVEIDPRRNTTVRSFALDGEPWRPTTAGASVFVPIGAGRVARLDPAAGIVDQPVEPLGDDPGRVVVVGVGDESLAVARDGTFGQLNEIGVAPSTDELHVTVGRAASDGARLWVTSDRPPIELISFTSAGPLTRAPLRGVGVDIAIGLGAVWVVTSEDNRLWRADPRSGEVLATLALPATPTGVVTTGDNAWVSLVTGQLLSIDPTGAGVTTTVQFDRPVVALAYGHGALWVGFD